MTRIRVVMDALMMFYEAVCEQLGECADHLRDGNGEEALIAISRAVQLCEHNPALATRQTWRPELAA